MTTSTEYFNEFLLHKALEFKHGPYGNTLDGLIDLMAQEQNKNSEFPIPLKNVCAKLTVELSDEIENICDLLSVSKRRFIEMAIINAIGRFKEIASEYDIYERYEMEAAHLDAEREGEQS